MTGYSLKEAIRLAADGRAEPMAIVTQLGEDSQDRLNSLCLAETGKKVDQLPRDEQCKILGLLADHLDDAGPAGNANSGVKGYSLKEAVELAVAGSLNPLVVFRNLPQNVSAPLSSYARSQFGREFEQLEEKQQRALLEIVARSLNKNEQPEPQTASVGDLVKMVHEGRLSAMDVYNQLDPSFRVRVDQVCQNMMGKEFKALTAEEQKLMFPMLMLAAVPDEGNSR